MYRTERCSIFADHLPIPWTSHCNNSHHGSRQLLQLLFPCKSESANRPTLVVPSRRFHRQRRRQWFPCQELGGVALQFLLITEQNMETILELASYWQHEERPAHVAEREENLARSLSRMARVGPSAWWPDARCHQPEQGKNQKKTGPEKKMSISENLTQDVWLNYHS